MTPNTAIKTVSCDCLNHCGDDPWLKDGRSKPCEKLKLRQEQERQRALETVRVNLLMQQYGATTVYDLIEHLHSEVTRLQGLVLEHRGAT